MATGVYWQRNSITPRTKILGVIGDPVMHSLSPAIHNAAIEALDLDYVYLGFEVSPLGLKAAVDGVRALGVTGLSVTMPHKQSIIEHLDVISGDAIALFSVNTVFVDGAGQLNGTSTDGPGFLDGLRLEAGFDPSGKRVGIIGTGGAARAIARALVDAGAETVAVYGRSSEKLGKVISLCDGRGDVATLEMLSDCDLIVNATPIGMKGYHSRDMVPVPDTVLHSGMVVCDIVYSPLVTEFMKQATKKGCKVVGGLPMLLHQAAHAFRLFTKHDPPLEVMRNVIESATGN
jgi:shikimate dehydrogenase